VDAQYRKQLVEECARLGIGLSGQQSDALIRYTRAVLDANEITNLTRIVDMRQAVHLHLVDSLSAIPELRSAQEGPLLDLGSGGGFPGVPLAIGSGRATVLLDSVKKKMAAVAAAIAVLSLGAQVQTVDVRAEEHALACPSGYAAVVARAVAPIASLVELAAPLLQQDGLFVAMKGEPSDEEVRRGREAARIVGLEEVSIRRFGLPIGLEARTIVTYRRARGPSIALPRRPGLAQHQPLA